MALTPLRGSLRSTKMVPLSRAAKPSIGQAARSWRANTNPPKHSSSTMMSSGERWLATTRRGPPPQRAG
jgi:hypothetical protein